MKEKTTVMAVVNQKGGTAKTTTVENLGIGLARCGKKVLLVDVDPQASLTICLGDASIKVEQVKWLFCNNQSGIIPC